ncbi:MAG: aminotransferase class I/II-fold pyridoxal phosphate-dependent enzyme [Clostridiales bacterium]|jgi:glycine C-acetyltransferase|nr:aminotransferase class I/II-fold pyridoxal phosphate-dependent enzyme [Clostridiales bacterium]
MDSTKMSLADFMNIQDVDIMERAERFTEFMEDVGRMKHLQYKRVSIDGSEPVRRIIDHYTGEIKEMIYFASNDYLNLTMHPKVVLAGIEAVERYGAGAGSVPLLGGTIDLHIELEKKIARFKGCESALIYTSGFGSNAGTLLALLQKEDIAVLDTLVHASIIDGCKNTNIKLFKHNNTESLEKALQKVKDKYRTKLVVVDGVYSMDGDIAPLDKIVELAKAYDAYVMVDEAHATGVIGKNGRGTPEHCGVEGKVDIVAGTFSKALGSVGGFIAANEKLVKLLTYYSRTYFFSTAMAPQAAASIITAIDVIEQEPVLREKLWDNIRYFRKNLSALGFNLGNSQTAIFPIIIGDDHRVREICRCLHEMNIYANPVPYPAVPKREGRIRMSLMATHTKEHLDKALDAMEYLGKKFGVIGNNEMVNT